MALGGINPYEEIPKDVFLVRLLPAVGMAFLFGLALVGIFSTAPAFHGVVEWNNVMRTLPPMEKGGPPFLNPFEYEHGGLLTGTFKHYERMVTYLRHFPDFCWGDAPNTFIAKRCDEFLSKFWGEVFLATVPFLLTLLTFALGWGWLTSFYRNSATIVGGGQALVHGVVTHPPLYPKDTLCRIFHLKAISVQKPDGQQIAVYFPAEGLHPGSGQQMAVFNGGTYLGRPRYIGVLYAPHMAIVRG